MKTTREGLNTSELDSRPQCRRGILFAFVLSVLLVFGLAFPTAGLTGCTDNDGDGYGVCPDCGIINDCTYDGDDCNDGDDTIHPGATEQCNGVDDDCDGDVDEGFTAYAGDPYAVFPDDPSPTDLPLGADCFVGVGECVNQGMVVCKADETGAKCSVNPLAPGTEGPCGDGTCEDLMDNDCDGSTDYADDSCYCATDQFCDGIDNDGDGFVDEDFDVGAPCTMGIGLCQNTGHKICNSAGDGTECNVAPYSGSSESPPGSLKCTDGLDNDCDGDIDLADSDCQEPEKCDGKDNDGDGDVDEDFALGGTCNVGEGACYAEGNMVCSADGTGTVCDATPGLGSPEGPAGVTCSDGIDNDCDGLTDGDDPNCGSATIWASCAIPVIKARPGDDCIKWHRVRYSYGNSADPDPDLEVTAELLALDVDGTVMAVLPVVDNEVAHLASRVDENDWKWKSKPNKRKGGALAGDGNWHEVFAPVPLLRVKVKDGLNTATAFCSAVPYLEVVEPSDTVVSASEGDIVHVLTAIPRVDPDTLFIKVDGVDILSEIPISDITSCTSISPCGGTVLINGRNVTVSDLAVEVSYSYDLESSNTLTMNLSNLGGGGHIVFIDGERQTSSLPSLDVISPDCHVDDIEDAGVAAVLAIVIDTPTEGEKVAGPDTHVTGEARHGFQITAAQINGLALDTAMSPGGPQSKLSGDGENSADTYVLPIDVLVPQTDLREEFDTGVGTTGTFDPGSNRLIAQVSDADLHTAFQNFFFSVGPVLDVPTVSHTMALAGAGAIHTASAVKVDKAFTLSMTDEALDTFFESVTDKVGPDIKDKLEDSLNGYSNTKTINKACDPSVTTTISGASVDISQFSTEVTPSDDKVNVKIDLPDMSFTAHSTGYCDDHFLGICVISLKVDITVPMTISGMSITFDVTEDSIMNNTEITPVFNPGTLTSGTGTNNSDVGCIAGFFIDVLDFLSFGLIDLNPEIETPATSKDLQEKLGLIQGDPFQLNLVKYSNEDLPAFGLKLTSGLSDVQITPHGIAVALGASFESTSVDPEVAEIPGTPITDAPLPQPPVPGADEVTIAISDDVFNQLFAGLTKAGKLKTLFEDVRPLGDYLSDNCSTLPTTAGQGFCAGVKCAGEPAGCCLGKPGAIICGITKALFQSKNITRNTPIILYGRVDVPPKLLIDDDALTPQVDVKLRLSQTSVSMIADRDGDGNHEGTLESVPPCFKTGTPTTGECSLWEACCNLNFFAGMELDQDAAGKPFIRTNVRNLEYDVSSGVLCGGGTDSDSGTTETIETISGGLIIPDIEAAAEASTPNLVSEGLTFGGLVEFRNARLFSINNGSTPDEFDDYIGITGELEKAAP